MRKRLRSLPDRRDNQNSSLHTWPFSCWENTVRCHLNSTRQIHLLIALRIIGLAIAYGVLARLVLTVSTANGNVTIFWIPGGLALAATLAWGVKVWPGIFIGALSAGLMVDDPVEVAIFLALGNTLETLIAFWLCKKRNWLNPEFDQTKDFLDLGRVAAVAAMISALIGPVTLSVAGYLTWEKLPYNIGHWWQADLLGILFGTPLFLAWRKYPTDWFSREKLVETLAIFVGTWLVGQVVFLEWFKPFLGNIALGYWLFLMLVWGAVRRGRQGVLLILAMVAIQALFGATQAVGFFANDIEQTGLQNFWFYLLVLSSVGVGLVIYVEGRSKAEETLLKSESRFHSLYNNMAEGVALHRFVLDSAGKKIDYVILDVNPAFELHTGLRTQEVIGKTATEAYGSVPYLDQYVAVTSEQNVQFQTYFEPLDKTFSISVVATDADSFATIFRDISEEVRLEKTLRQASARFEAIIEASPIPMALNNEALDIVYLNDAFVQVFGYTLSDIPIIAAWWPKAYPDPDYREQVQQTQYLLVS